MKVVRSSNVNVEDAFPLNMPCKLQFNLSMLQYMSLANDLGLYCLQICLTSYVCLDFSGRGDLKVLEDTESNTEAPCDATNKEAFFSRVESYSISFFKIFLNFLFSFILTQTLCFTSLYTVKRLFQKFCRVCFILLVCPVCFYIAEIFLSRALFEMGRQTTHAISPDVRQIRLD